MHRLTLTKTIAFGTAAGIALQGCTGPQTAPPAMVVDGTIGDRISDQPVENSAERASSAEPQTDAAIEPR